MTKHSKRNKTGILYLLSYQNPIFITATFFIITFNQLGTHQQVWILMLFMVWLGINLQMLLLN